VSCGQHPAASLLAATEPSIDQIAPGSLDVLERDLLRPPEDSFPGHVAEEINATEVAIKLREHGPNLLWLRNIASCWNGAPIMLFSDCIRGLPSASGVDIRQHYVRASLSQGQGHGTTEPAGRTGNQRDTSAQIEHLMWAHQKTF
jgi:hypothetical protein